MTVQSKQIWKTESLPQMCVYVGCQINSDQALRLPCLSRHVRAHGATLWWHQLIGIQCIVVYQTPLFWWSSDTKKSPTNPENTSLTSLKYYDFKTSWHAQKKKCLVRFFETVLRKNYRINCQINYAELIWGHAFCEVVWFTVTVALCRGRAHAAVNALWGV